MSSDLVTLPHGAAKAEQHKNQPYPALDWLRMALATEVALAHLDVVLPAPFDGHFAVEVFLALSGWLIGGILVRSDFDDLPRFFYNRVTRIWLPYAAAIAALYGLALLREGPSANFLKYLFYDVTFTHYNFVLFPRATTEMPLGGSGNQFWSLAVEEQFYLLTPIFMLFVPFGKRVLPWVVLGGLALSLQSVLAPITLGVTSAILQRKYGDWHMCGLVRPAVIVATLTLGWAAHHWDLPPLRALFAGGIVLSLAFPGQRGGVGTFLGGLSYPFYLNHWIGGFVIHGISKLVHLPFPVAVVCALAVSFLVGTIAWYLIDRPIVKWRGRWFSPTIGRRLAVTSYLLVATGLLGGFLIARAGG